MPASKKGSDDVLATLPETVAELHRLNATHRAKPRKVWPWGGEWTGRTVEAFFHSCDEAVGRWRIAPRSPEEPARRYHGKVRACLNKWCKELADQGVHAGNFFMDTVCYVVFINCTFGGSHMGRWISPMQWYYTRAGILDVLRGDRKHWLIGQHECCTPDFAMLYNSGYFHEIFVERNVHELQLDYFAVKDHFNGEIEFQGYQDAQWATLRETVEALHRADP